MDSHTPTPFGIGTATPRFEDARLLRGLGQYTDDIHPPNAAFMVVVRSPHASARILSIDTEAARAAPGVLAVLTGADLLADGIGPLQTMVQRHRADGSPMARPPYHALATDAARFAGDAVAIVVATTLPAAHDAAELVAVDYDPLPAVTDAVAAAAPGAPAVWPGHAPDNQCFVFRLGDAARTDAAFAAAHHVTRLELPISRVSANPIEPRTATAAYDPARDTYTLHAGTQAPHKVRSELAEHTLRIPANRLRVISPDVGGAFGMKGSPYPEYALVLWAARRTGRTVRWTATRSESLLSDFHARDVSLQVELALDAHGTFLGLRVRSHANLGAYLGFNTPHSSTNNLGGLAGMYRTPAIHAEVFGMYTNTQPNGPYRGAGRPEATYAIERAIDQAALETGIDRIELRRRNLIPASAMPFRTGLVFTYDSGDFPAIMARALEAADWQGFEARRAESAARGRLRGIGLANAIEIAGGPAPAPMEEAAEIRFDPDGSATILLGTHSQGQGHETAFRQIAATHLGLAPDQVTVAFGDTGAAAYGRGTFGSRSIMAGGSAFVRASAKVVERGRAIAAHMLETAAADIEFEQGRFSVAGTDRFVSLPEVARASFVGSKLPPGAEYGLGATAIVPPGGATFPNGTHVCELEVDPETGTTAVLRYLVVDDVGTVINPLLVKGQIHGGVAQGLGQIFLEAVRYDADGQMLSGSFMDYAMPRASDLCTLDVISHPVPTATNPLGAKGAGEAGTVGALPALMNALLDALRPHGVTHVDMPATPQAVWSALNRAETRGRTP